MIESIDVVTAHQRLTDGTVCIDVRSVNEFRTGHPEGAVNIPLLDTDTSGLMVPNPNFVGTVLGRFERTEPLMLLCKVGGRSAHACQILADQGYERLANVVGGMHGPGGWTQEGLPVRS